MPRLPARPSTMPTVPREGSPWPDSYAELRLLASTMLRAERRDHTLQPTALVHEVYLRFQRDRRMAGVDRATLIAQAARAMRDVLVEHARRRRAAKRGGDPQRTELTDALLAFEERAGDLLALHEALQELQEVDPDLARLVEVRFFGGLTEPETARVLGVSPRTVRRSWRLARRWLWQRLEGDDRGS
ncbi:MAG: ECF-type sigma factor [Planctomycetota bacterium]